MTDPIYVTEAQVLAARLILVRDAAAGRVSDGAVIAIATAPKVAATVRRNDGRQAG